MSTPAAESQSDFIIERAVISSNRSGNTEQTGYDIARVITDFEVFEHLDKPYLTGNVLFIDKVNILQRLDIQGGEQFSIRIKSSLNEDSVIDKTFFIEKINTAVRSADQEEVVSLRLIENIAFISSVKNVNKSFTGSPQQIVEQLLYSYLNKDVSTSQPPYQSRMKVIVPNMNPLEACVWIKNKSTNIDGLPFYLYSVFGDDTIRFNDLGTLLRADIINKKAPYAYWQSASQSMMSAKYTVVQSYSLKNHDDLLSLVRSGVVGSENNFYNTMNGTFQHVKFNVATSAFKPLIENDYFDDNQRKFNFGPSLKIDDQEIANWNSRVISRVSSANTYKNIGDYKTLEEENSAGGYEKRIIGNALKYFMTKNPIEIQVYGRDFIIHEKNRKHYTIGNKIRFLILDSLIDTGEEPKFDKKKSGDYIIYATRHKFSAERYDIKLLCTKLASYLEDPQV